MCDGQISILLLALLVAFSFVGCDNENPGPAVEGEVLFTLTEDTVDLLNDDGVQTLTNGALEITTKGWQITLNTDVEGVPEVAVGDTIAVTCDVALDGEGAVYKVNTLVTNMAGTTMETYPSSISESGSVKVVIENKGADGGIVVTIDGGEVAADTDNAHYSAGEGDENVKIGIGGWVEGDGAKATITNMKITKQN